MELWPVILLVLTAPLIIYGIWSQRRIQQLKASLADNENKLESYQQQLVLLQENEVQSKQIINLDEDRRNQLLASLNLLLEKVSELDSLFSRQVSTVNDALCRVSQESKVSQHSDEEALKSVESGREELPRLNQVLGQFSQMDNSMQELSQLIQSVSAHSESIDRIANESRILSLNASIEAARAGAQGRGFAVVAESVTDLADKSAGSARSIHTISQEGKSLLEHLLLDSGDVIQQTERLLESFSTVYQQVDQNMAQANSASESLQAQLIEFQSTYDEMNSSSKTIFESLINELSMFVAHCNGTELVDLSVKEARAGLASYDHLIDVRRPDEFNDNLGHIAGTINMNVQAADFEQKLEQLDKSKNYLWICRSGGRSKRAALLALRKGFTGQCHNMLGGMLAWNEAAFPTENSANGKRMN